MQIGRYGQHYMDHIRGLSAEMQDRFTLLSQGFKVNHSALEQVMDSLDGRRHIVQVCFSEVAV